MAGDGVAPVFDAEVALDRAHDEPAEKAHEREDQGHDEGSQGREGRGPPESGSGPTCGESAEGKAFHGFIGADVGGDLPFTEGFAKDVLEDIAELNHGDEEEEELGIFPFVTRNLHGHEHGDVADEVDADEKSPLDLGRALQEAIAIASEDGSDRDEDKGVDRNEDLKHAIPLNPDEEILQGDDDEKDPKESAMVAAFGWGQGDVFPHRHEGNEAEHEGNAPVTDEDIKEEDAGHDPPSAGAGDEVIDGGIRDLSLAAFANPADDGSDGKEGDGAAGEVKGFRIPFHGAGGSVEVSWRSSWRMRARKSGLDSSGDRRCGPPKRQRLIKGTGRNSPFGKIRFRFSR